MSERKKGATSVSLLFRLTDATTGAAKSAVDVTTLKLQYERPSEAASAATSLTLLAALTTAFTVYGAKEVDATNSKGIYRVDCPDAAFATGADEVTLSVSGTGIETSTRLIDLTNADMRDGVRMGLASLPNAAAAATGGLPTVDAANAVKLQSGTGANQLSLASGLVTLAPVTHTGATIPTVTTTGTATVAGTVNALASGAITAASIAADAITAAKIADGAIDTATFAVGTTIPRVTLCDTATATGSVTGNVAGKVLGGGATAITGVGVAANTTQFGGQAVVLDVNNYPGVNLVDVAGSAAGSPVSGAINANVVSVNGTTFAGANVPADHQTIKGQAVTAASGVTFPASINGTTPPTAAAIATAVWTTTTAGDFATVGSPGKVLVTQLGGTFTTTTSSVFTTPALANGPNGSGATPAAIADAVWDELRSDHVGAGSFGQGVASVSGTVNATVAGYATNQDPATLLGFAGWPWLRIIKAMLAKSAGKNVKAVDGSTSAFYDVDDPNGSPRITSTNTSTGRTPTVKP